MKRRGRLAALVAAALLACGLLAALPGCSSGGASGGSSGGSGTLTVGVRGDVVGFGQLNERTGKYSGLEVDIAEELANRLGYVDVQFKSVLPENRKQMLLDGEVDALVACYSISDTRRQNFDFSPAYYTDASIVMVQNSSLITDIAQMKGKTFGTMAGSNTAPELVLKLKELGLTDGVEPEPVADGENKVYRYDTFTLIQLPSYQALSDALEQGAVDAAAMDGAIAKTYDNDDRTTLDFQISTQEYGVATQKGSELSGKVSDAIQGMLDDGTIATLIDKWN